MVFFLFFFVGFLSKLLFFESKLSKNTEKRGEDSYNKIKNHKDCSKVVGALRGCLEIVSWKFSKVLNSEKKIFYSKIQLKFR